MLKHIYINIETREIANVIVITCHLSSNPIFLIGDIVFSQTT